MNTPENDPIDRSIDEVLASMVEGEPRRVSAASVRQAVGECRRPRFPVWLAAAAVLIVGLGIMVKPDAPVERAHGVAQSAPSSWPAESPNAASTNPVQLRTVSKARTPSPTRIVLAAASYEGLPRLAIDTIEVPEPLSTDRLTADPIRIPGIEIAPLSVSTLSTEQEHNQEPSR